jgi:class 3 adenylate cyclase/tetratricopeptide (TPR) repeat protein
VENDVGALFCMSCGTPLPGACRSCGAPVPEDARFCPQCGAPFGGAATPHAVAPETERRILTILFVDLVGFTERSDQADPEDVRNTLVPFHRRVQAELERFGGTLDKFIGDAVMGVFGAPIAHEDDPERAVRAALAILLSIEELAADDPAVAVRIAVNTGEAVVSFGTGPQIGEAVAGDVVNTTSRMESAAPRGSVVVGPETHAATRDHFRFRELEPVRAKGKAEPLRIWQVLGEGGPDSPERQASFVGRGGEMALLRDLFVRTTRDGVGQLITLVGEPGIGKTRLLEELRREVGGRAGWMGGSCLPYGEGITFSAISDVIRACAGIERSDDPGLAHGRLRELAGAVESTTAEQEWLLGRLEPLLGLGGTTGDERWADATIPPRESATACARVLTDAARERPLVVVIEDLHWGEPALRDVLESLADQLLDCPIMLICSARPELLDEGRWGGGRLNSTTMRLTKLSDPETVSLLSDQLMQMTLPDDTRLALLDRAGGNPLYALEFVRMLVEVTPPNATGRGTIPMPGSIHALIAARLDAIPSDLRGLLQDAAVIGPEFWPGALAAIGSAPQAQIRGMLGELVRRGLIRREPEGWLPDEPSYVFTHALIREVAYSRISRPARAQRHLVAGRWLEQSAGDRAPEKAETLASHFAQAVELAGAAALDEQAEEARGPAVRWLLVAARSAARLDQAGAFALYGRAVSLAPELSEELGEALAGSALMGRRTGALSAAEVLSRYERALELAQARGDQLAAGNALVRMGSQLGAMGEKDRAHAALKEAVERLEAEPPGPELARACAFRAEEELFAGKGEAALSWADRALELGRRFDAVDVQIIALHIRGDSRCSRGDPTGLEDLHEALRLSEATGNASDIVTSQNYLAEWLWALEGAARAVPYMEAAVELAERRGAVSQGQWAKTGSLMAFFEWGDWDRVLLWADEVLAAGREMLDETLWVVARVMRSWVLLLRGSADEADDYLELVDEARPLREMQAMAPTLVVGAALAQSAGHDDHARALLVEFEETTRDVASEYREAYAAEVARLCVALGIMETAELLAADPSGASARDRLYLKTTNAILSEARGDLDDAERRYEEVAAAWSAFGCPREEAEAISARARCRERLGAVPLAADIARADQIFQRLGVPSGA